MARSRLFREGFDRRRELVVMKPFIFNGEGFVVGQVLKDKSGFTDRRLRQLYDLRKLEMMPRKGPNLDAMAATRRVNGYHHPPEVAIARPLEPPEEAIEPVISPTPSKPRVERRRFTGKL